MSKGVGLMIGCSLTSIVPIIISIYKFVFICLHSHGHTVAYDRLFSCGLGLGSQLMIRYTYIFTPWNRYRYTAVWNACASVRTLHASHFSFQQISDANYKLTGGEENPRQ